MNKECVILLHGLARTKRSMYRMAKYFNNQGYCVVNIDYPSRKHTIQFLVENYLTPVVIQYANKANTKIHFVTHSLGSILVRYYLQKNTLNNLGRVVMLAPPNQGSKLADFLQKFYLCRWFFGPVLAQLGTKTDSVPLSLGNTDFECGVIAGNIAFNSDGVLSVRETKVNSMNDYLQVRCPHIFIMCSKKVITAAFNFIKSGRFKT